MSSDTTAKPSGVDARVAPRVAVRAQVELTFDDWRIPTQTYTANVSETGLFAVKKNPPPVGSLVKFSLRTDSGSEIRGMAEVVWVRLKTKSLDSPNGVGLRYRWLDAEGQEKLRELVASHLGPGTPPGSATA